MEKLIKDFVNIGIGLVKTIQKEADKRVKKFQETGEQADDDLSRKIREYVEKAFAFSEDAGTKAKEKVKETQDTADNILTAVKIQSAINEVKDGIMDLGQKIGDIFLDSSAPKTDKAPENDSDMKRPESNQSGPSTNTEKVVNINSQKSETD